MGRLICVFVILKDMNFANPTKVYQCSNVLFGKPYTHDDHGLTINDVFRTDVCIWLGTSWLILRFSLDRTFCGL